jgi:uncharacterized repeat protein (TIGR01451 family)
MISLHHTTASPMKPSVIRLALLLVPILLSAQVAVAAPTVALATSNATPVAGGAAYFYTITINNPDAATANNLSVSLPLPQSFVFQNLSIAGTGGGGFSCTHPGTNENGLILCRASSLAASATATISATVTVQSPVASGVRTATARLVVGNTATTANVQVNIQVNAPLSVSLSGPGGAVRGERVSFLLSVNNNGQSTALNTALSATLPPGFSHFSAQGTNGLANACDYTISTRTLSCSGVNLPRGFSRLTWTAEISPSAPTGNTQTVFTIDNAGTGTIVVGSSSVIFVVN